MTYGARPIRRQRTAPVRRAAGRSLDGADPIGFHATQSAKHAQVQHTLFRSSFRYCRSPATVKNVSGNNDMRLLTRNEVEERYGISKRFLELAVSRGGGPPTIRIGPRTVRYLSGDIEAWIDALRTRSAEDDG